MQSFGIPQRLRQVFTRHANRGQNPWFRQVHEPCGRRCSEVLLKKETPGLPDEFSSRASSMSGRNWRSNSIGTLSVAIRGAHWALDGTDPSLGRTSNGRVFVWQLFADEVGCSVRHHCACERAGRLVERGTIAIVSKIHLLMGIAFHDQKNHSFYHFAAVCCHLTPSEATTLSSRSKRPLS